MTLTALRLARVMRAWDEWIWAWTVNGRTLTLWARGRLGGMECLVLHPPQPLVSLPPLLGHGRGMASGSISLSRGPTRAQRLTGVGMP